MEYFYSGGGRSDPDFLYRFAVTEVTTEMWKWCERYPLTGPFERWYVKHARVEGTNDIVTFESRKAAYMFRLAYSEYILKDMTYDFATSIDAPFNS